MAYEILLPRAQVNIFKILAFNNQQYQKQEMLSLLSQQTMKIANI